MNIPEMLKVLKKKCNFEAPVRKYEDERLPIPKIKKPKVIR